MPRACRVACRALLPLDAAEGESGHCWRRRLSNNYAWRSTNQLCPVLPAALNSKEAEEAFAAGGGGRKAQAERMLAEAKAAAGAAAKAGGGGGKAGGQQAARPATAAAGGSDPRLRSAPRQELNVRCVWGGVGVCGQGW